MKEITIYRMPCPKCGALKPEELGYDVDNVAHLRCKECGTCYRADLKEGLCSNCKHRETCTYPNARQNVLHCEEYE